MALVKYDFNNLLEDISNLIVCANEPANKYKISTICNSIKLELNKFFRDSTCEEILYTNNTDKLFFGMCCYPNIEDKDVYKFLEPSEEKIRITSYMIEFDSKLFDPMMDLKPKEILAIMLHEIGHLVNDTKPADTMRMNFAHFCNKEKLNIHETNNKNYIRILKIGIRDSLRKMFSIFDNKDEEILADEFVIAYGYGPHLANALEKIYKNHRSLNRDVNNKFIVMAWTLRLYADVKHKRIPALRTLNRMKDVTSSTVEKKEYESLRGSLLRIDDDAMIAEGAVFGMVKSLKKKGIRGYEEDYYEYLLTAKNIKYEEDALVLVHKINSRMAIIDDYLSDEDLEPQEKKRWSDLYNKYDKLRELLTNKTLVKDQYRRIYINYPDEKGE